MQTDRIPLRFLIQQLHDGFQIVLTGIASYIPLLSMILDFLILQVFHMEVSWPYLSLLHCGDCRIY